MLFDMRSGSAKASEKPRLTTGIRNPVACGGFQPVNRKRVCALHIMKITPLRVAAAAAAARG